MSSLSFSCPARAGLLHSALIFCKLIPTIRPFRFAQWYYQTTVRLYNGDRMPVTRYEKVWVGKCEVVRKGDLGNQNK
ncbi:hypothetical protein [Rubritalea tangerina]|uniref:hypothetical protein n=1 Tax=Rubritalea tangerina TaxID=430798 RepID=UPI0036135C43